MSEPFAWLRLAPTRSHREKLKVGQDGEKTKAPVTPEQQAYLDAVKKVLPNL